MLVLSAVLAFAPPVPDTLAPPPRPARGWVLRHTLRHPEPVVAITSVPGAFVTGDANGRVTLWDAQTGAEQKTLFNGNADFPAVPLLAPADAGRRVNISFRAAGTHYQYVLAGTEVGLRGPSFTAVPLALTADGRWLVLMGDDPKCLCPCEMELRADGSGQAGYTNASPHPADVRLAAANSHKAVVTADARGCVRGWTYSPDDWGKARWAADLAELGPMALAVSPDGALVAVAGEWGRVAVLDARRGRAVATLKGHRGAVRAVAFAPDSGLIATGGADGTVRLWNPWTGEQEHELPGHRGGVLALWFASDDRLVTGGRDRTARVWEYRP